ncbi:uncharacterized protein FTOL_10613 [Fusarium torulosum]|uniref:Uncharacterized protein n=1 Tax=Fusarium torulosum TaxID=33205 RepID=A0AAE8SM72_9HYPO|nr:uncharacterized protein FTOL_10613 [Fusarium torulosum]
MAPKTGQDIFGFFEPSDGIKMSLLATP